MRCKDGSGKMRNQAGEVGRHQNLEGKVRHSDLSQDRWKGFSDEMTGLGVPVRKKRVHRTGWD